MMTTNNPNTDVLAWTKNDGVTPPPKGVRPSLLGGTAVAMSGIWVALLSFDTLCPEHRAWIEVIATAALVTAGIAIIGLLRQRSWSAMFALASAIGGINIGAIEATHDPAWGLTVMIGFTIVAAFLAFAVVRQYQSAKWSRTAAAELTHLPDVDVDTAVVANGSDGASTAVTEVAENTADESASV